MQRSTFTRFLFTIVMIAAIAVVSSGATKAATVTRTNAYTYFYYEGEIPQFVFVYFNATGRIVSLDDEDKYKVFRVAVKGEFFSDRSCYSLTHSRPTCVYQIIGTPNNPLEVGDNLHAGDSWFAGDCNEDEGYRSAGASYVYGGSATATDTDCRGANCN